MIMQPLIDGVPVDTPTRDEYEIHAIRACGFQEYEYVSGDMVEDGDPVGIEIEGTVQLYDEIVFSDEQFPCEGCENCRA